MNFSSNNTKNNRCSGWYTNSQSRQSALQTTSLAHLVHDFKSKNTMVNLMFNHFMGIGVFFCQQLVCCTFLDPTHVRHGVVVYSQSYQ